MSHRVLLKIFCVCQWFFFHLLVHIGINWGTSENTWGPVLRGSHLVYLSGNLVCVCFKSSPGDSKKQSGFRSVLIPQ